MIIVTGAAGFIGSCMVSKLNQENFKDIVVVDDFSRADKNKNLEGKIYSEKVHRDDFMKKLDRQYPIYDFAKNKGYGTAHHLNTLKESGYTSWHRKSFKGVVVK